MEHYSNSCNLITSSFFFWNTQTQKWFNIHEFILETEKHIFSRHLCAFLQAGSLWCALSCVWLMRFQMCYWRVNVLSSFSKTGLVSSTWDRQFYFTQGGNLMSQARGDVAGGLAMDIDNCSVMAVDCEDRRYCFQITSFDGKKLVFFPAIKIWHILSYWNA